MVKMTLTYQKYQVHPSKTKTPYIDVLRHQCGQHNLITYQEGKHDETRKNRSLIYIVKSFVITITTIVIKYEAQGILSEFYSMSPG